MKKLFISILLSLLFISPTYIYAQSMMGGQFQANPDDHTAGEEAEGKEIWKKLLSKQTTCEELTDDNYEVLGEYFMGQSIGNTERHAAMNQMMTNMMGENGEKQMHIALGKRLSGCDTNASYPSSGLGFMPMMGMMYMMGSAFAPWSFGEMKGGGNPMMGSFGTNQMGTFGWGFGWIFMILFWGLIILGIVALVKWIANQGKSQTQEKSALDILKERYAKGEIDKKEFEEIKKDLR